MEENKNINVIEMEEDGTVTFSEESIENNGMSVIVPIVCGVAIVAGAVVAYIHKTKDKREQKQIEKLRKKGYKIEAPVIEVDFSECVEAEEIEE